MYSDNIDLLAFNVKLLGSRTRNNILVSAGKAADKQKLLPSIKELLKAKVRLYSTHGTSIYLNDNGIDNQEIYKIAEKKEPNIHSYLQSNRFDLVINILTGDHDYDEKSDSNIIRAACVENGIPLITDLEVARLTIKQLVASYKKGVSKFKLSDPSEPWNMKREYLSLVHELGGFKCYHAHLDKAYLISTENLRLSQVDMQKKWELYKYLKENYTHQDLAERISKGIETMIQQGVTHCRSFIDADDTVKLLPIKVAIEQREKYKNQIHIEFAVQPLQGVLDKKSRKYFESACELADVIGGLPSKDRPTPEKHIDFIMSLAKEMDKPVDVHIDQENNPNENETELLAVKTIEHGLEGKVMGVHAISLAAKPKNEQEKLIRLVKEAGMGIIVCPSAAISMKQLDVVAPLHNSIAPVNRLLANDVPVFLGVDNIHDLFMPLVDGDMWFESRLLMEATRFYDIESVAKIATNKSGFLAQEKLKLNSA